MATTFTYKTQSLQTLLSTELNSLTNGSFATAGTAYDNSNLDLWGDFELVLATGSNMTAGNPCDLYFLEAVDGTNYADTSGPPPNAFVGSFIVQAATSLRVVLRGIPLPPCKFKAYLKNGSGQNLSASGSTLKMLPYSQQGS